MKTVLVTGVSGGIGAAVARKFLAEGWRVAGMSRSPAETVTPHFPRESFAYFSGDLGDAAARAGLIALAKERFGAIHALVNVAGVAPKVRADLLDMTEESYDFVMDSNTKGTLFLTQLVANHMAQNRSGSIVNISSMWGLRGASCEVGYSATKAAVIGLTRSLAMELAPSHIRVNCVAPGVIHTDMVDKLGEETMESLREQTPLGRLGTPEDIAQAVSFLAGDSASFITGQVLTADGGFIL